MVQNEFYRIEIYYDSHAHKSYIYSNHVHHKQGHAYLVDGNRINNHIPKYFGQLL